MKRTRTRLEGLALVRRWKDSGQSITGFAEKEGLSRYALHYWIKQARKPADSTREPLVEIKLDNQTLESARTSPWMAIVFPSGIRVELPNATDLALVLAQVARL